MDKFGGSLSDGHIPPGALSIGICACCVVAAASLRLADPSELTVWLTMFTQDAKKESNCSDR